MLSFPYQRKLSLRIAVHILFWLAYVIINTLTIKKFYPDEGFLHLAGRISLTLPIDVMATYFTVFFLFPRYLYRRKLVGFLIWFIPSVIGFILLQRLTVDYITYPTFFPGEQPSSFWRFSWFSSFTNIYMVVIAVGLAKMLQVFIRQQRDAQVLGRERIEAELKFLKAQVHPHFLFNTLNNLYALALDRSEKTPEIVLKLSDLLNYMLYECNEPTILLTKEISLLENFLELERMRYGNQLVLSFEVKGEITGKRIAPMILLPFVENAFKHGVSKISKEANVNINIDVEENCLSFRVENSKPVVMEKDLSGYTEGIGLKNVQRRLELLYNDDFQLDITEDSNQYSIDLKINLEIKQ